MTRTIAIILAAALAALVPANAHAQGKENGVERHARVIGPGVTHISERNPKGPLNIQVLKADLSNPYLKVETEQGRDRMFAGEKINDMVARESAPGARVIAGTNGDFWTNDPRSFRPIGVSVSDGMIYTMPSHRSSFCVAASGEAHIGVVTMDVVLSIGSKDHAIEGINNARAGDGLVVYTPRFAGEIPAAKRSFIVLKMEGEEFLPNKPVKVRAGAAKASAPESVKGGTLLLAAGGTEAATAAKAIAGREGTLLARMPEIDGPVGYCIGGGPRLVRDGAVSVEWEEERLGESFSTTRHPRTAVGLAQDRKTLYLLTVDGRQPLVSVGMSLDELAEKMKALGCHDAMNLDGGGSTTMIVRDKVANSPSDRGGPRTVTNGILLVSTAPSGPLGLLELTPDDSPLQVPAGGRVVVSANGFDLNYGDAALPGPLEWKLPAGWSARPDGPGAASLMPAPDAVDGRAEVRVGGTTVTAAFDVAAVKVDEVVVHPNPVLLNQGETQDLKVTAYAAGRPVKLRPEMVSIELDDAIASATLSRIEGKERGRATANFRVGTMSAEVPYFVEDFRVAEVESFDEIAADAAPTGIRFAEDKTGLSLETEKKKQGAAALRLSYAMAPGGTSKIAVPVNKPIAGKPSKLSIWVYGDGGEAWLRGELEDANTNRFLVDFTDGGAGIFWKDEWRQRFCQVENLVPHHENPGAIPAYPMSVREVYIAQAQEALKTSGTLLLDGLEAVYPPDSNPAQP